MLQSSMNTLELEHIKTVSADSRGRVPLGELTRTEKRFQVFQDSDGRIILEPLVEIPASELWLYKNPERLASVIRGFREAEVGKLTATKEDFTKDISS